MFNIFLYSVQQFSVLKITSANFLRKPRAVDTGGARGAMTPPLFSKIILFVFSAKHSFSSSRVWILYINNWIHCILNDNKVIN